LLLVLADLRVWDPQWNLAIHRGVVILIEDGESLKQLLREFRVHRRLMAGP
jgi:hypothetical protein